MTDIVAFLTARLDEDEAAANEFYTKRGNDPFTHHNALFQARSAVLGLEFVKAPRFSAIEYEALNHVLADVAAKRAIIEKWRLASDGVRRDDCDEAMGAAWATLSEVLVALAGAYRSHPDYKGHDTGGWNWPDDD